MCAEIVNSFAANPEYTLGLALGSAGIAAVVLITWTICRAAVRCNAEREQTRREIAAYVAEGAISPDDAERIIQPSPWWAKHCANAFGGARRNG